MSPTTNALLYGTPDKGFLHCNDGVDRISYGSIDELLRRMVDVKKDWMGEARIEKDRRSSSYNKSCFDSHYSQCSDFSNDYNVDKAVKALANPPKKFLMEVAAIRSSIRSRLEFTGATQRKYGHRRREGDELDFDAWREKKEDCWSRMEREPKPSRIYRIGVNLSVNANRKPKEVLYRGAAAVAIAEELIASGYNVRLDALVGVSDLWHGHKNPDDKRKRTGNKSMVRVEAKKPDHAIDLAAVAFACCEIGFFRSIMLCQLAADASGEVEYGMGRSDGVYEGERDYYDIVLDHNIFNEERAVATVKKFVENVRTESGAQSYS